MAVSNLPQHARAHNTTARTHTVCGIYRSDALAPVEENAPFFRRDYGGIQGRKKNGTPLGEIYFIGIIDILTTYSYGKSAENFVKSLFVNKVPPSCVCVR